MAKDLRNFVDRYREKYPNDVLEIEKEVSAKWEISYIARLFREQNRYPLLIFKNVRTCYGEHSEWPCIVNVLGCRRKLAMAIDSNFKDVSIDWRKRAERKVDPVLVPRAEATVKQNVLSGEAVDLLKLPILHHHEKDPGPYVTAGMFTAYDPGMQHANPAIQRGYVSGKREIRVFLTSRSHNNLNLEAHRGINKEMPVAFWVGHHPAVLMGCHTQLGYPESHYPVAGGVIGEPLRLTASETLGDDFLVPADAEFVIEGFISPGDVAEEAPFGEYPRYYGPQRMSPRMRVTALTWRENAVWHSFMVATNNVYGGTQEEGGIYAVVKRAVPQVQRVYVPVSGSGRFHAYIQIRKTHDGQPREAIMAALSSSYMIKHVVVVDTDIDIYKDEEVLWAIATRSQWDRDLVVVPRSYGSVLDPSADQMTGLSTKGGIDATMPIAGFSERVSFPDEIVKRLSLAQFFDQSVVTRVPVHGDENA